MISDLVKEKLGTLRQEIESLRSQEQKLVFESWKLIVQHLKTPEDCDEALDFVPMGFVSFCVRRKKADLLGEGSHS